jgi:iron complex outermembrane receptor protein
MFLGRFTVGIRPSQAFWALFVLTLGIALLLAGAARADQVREYDFNIPRQNVEAALNELATQADTLLLFPYDPVQPVSSNPVIGMYTVEDALGILLQDTGLTGGLTEGGVITISQLASKDPGNEMKTPKSTAFVKKILTFLVSASAASATVGQEYVEAERGEKGHLYIEEIIVTATKRGETLLQETPLSITAFSSKALEISHIESMRDIGQYTPGLDISGVSSHAELYIRGVGNNNVFAGSDSSSTMHLDGVYLARPLMVFSDFLDIERIEVLRGPQGTLYGRNSTGGNINIISRLPSDELRMSFSGEYGNYDKFKFTGNVSGPLVEDKVMAGISFLKKDRDGYVDNISPNTNRDHLNDEDSFAVRGSLRVVPTESIEAVLIVDYFKEDNHGNVQKAFHIDEFGNPFFIPIPWFSPTIIADPWTVSLPGDFQSHELVTRGITGKITADLPHGITLTSITAYRDVDFWSENDADFTDVNAFGQFNGFEKQDQLSQEFQLNGEIGNLDWLVGLYYFEEEVEFHGILAGADPGFFPPVFEFKPFAIADTEAFAAYFHGVYAVTDKLSVTAGVRYSDEERSMNMGSAAFMLGGIPLPGAFTNIDSADWDAWTPKVGVDYKVNDDLMIYASVSRGFKSGGFNSFASSAEEAYNPEYIWAYEIGIKSDWADNRLRANASAFYYDYTDLQVLGFTNFSAASLGMRVTNAASVTIQGFELEITAKPVPQFMLTAGVAYLDATYDEYLTARAASPTVPVDVSGNVLNHAPEWAVNLAAQYDVVVKDYGTLSFHVGYNWQDDIYISSPFNDPKMGQDAYYIVDARIGFVTHDDRWEFAVFGNNLTDEVYHMNKNMGGLGMLGQITPPRTFGVKATYRY